jgi:hypothetical protein
MQLDRHMQSAAKNIQSYLVITGTDDVSIPSCNSLIIAEKMQELGLCRLKELDMD